MIALDAVDAHDDEIDIGGVDLAQDRNLRRPVHAQGRGDVDVVAGGEIAGVLQDAGLLAQSAGGAALCALVPRRRNIDHAQRA